MHLVSLAMKKRKHEKYIFYDVQKRDYIFCCCIALAFVILMEYKFHVCVASVWTVEVQCTFCACDFHCNNNNLLPLSSGHRADDAQRKRECECMKWRMKNEVYYRFRNLISRMHFRLECKQFHNNKPTKNEEKKTVRNSIFEHFKEIIMMRRAFHFGLAWHFSRNRIFILILYFERWKYAYSYEFIDFFYCDCVLDWTLPSDALIFTPEKKRTTRRHMAITWKRKRKTTDPSPLTRSYLIRLYFVVVVSLLLHMSNFFPMTFSLLLILEYPRAKRTSRASNNPSNIRNCFPANV